MRRLLFFALSLLTAPALTACQSPAKVTVVPGSHREDLVFRLAPGGDADTSGTLPGLASLTVQPDPSGRGKGDPAPMGGVAWQIVATEAARDRPAPRTVRYGEIPPGYVQTRSPAILGPGRYRVTVTGPGVRGMALIWLTADGGLL